MQHNPDMAADFLQKSRHGSVYYFRRRVPADLFDSIRKRQIYQSLDTSDRREAIIRARSLAGQTDRLFAALRSMSKSHTLRTDYVVELKFDLRGLPQVRIEAEPGEQEAAQKALETAVAGLAALNSTSGSAASQTASNVATSGPTLAQGVAEYLSKADIKPATRASYRTKLRYMAQQLGADTPLFSVDQARFSQLAETILSDDSRHEKTQGDYITIIGGFLNWHRIRRGLQQLTAATLKPKRTKPSSLDRDAYTLDQLRIVFEHAATYRKSEPHKFWVTVATALLGCRVEELAQVNLHTDLRHDPATGVWYLVLDETVDADGVLRKSLKRLASWRHVPIHSALVQHGFIEYLTRQRDAGYSRPFEAGWKPHVGKEVVAGKANSGGVKWSHKITKWGGNALAELRDAGLLPDGALSYFHSMRHSFANTLATARVTEEYRAALAGQAFGGMNAQTYAKLRQNHNALSETIELALTPYVAILEEVSAM